jgi:deoxyribodipyrimidine photolyase
LRNPHVARQALRESLRAIACADGDPANSDGDRRWAAGRGTDAAPVSPIFTPVVRSKTCDPRGIAIHRWIPGLPDVPDTVFHEP